MKFSNSECFAITLLTISLFFCGFRCFFFRGSIMKLLAALAVAPILSIAVIGFMYLKSYFHTKNNW